MKIAFVFPGQGSQSVGMLDAFGADPDVQAVLATANEALGEDLATLIARGPAEALGLTVNTQPAMLAAGVAIYRAWRAAGGPEPAVMAGHSLGEYSALTAAGALPLAAALRLVRFRARAMQEAVPAGSGAMAAILGLSDEAVLQACAEAARGEVLEAVNFNAPLQVVIAGHAAAVTRGCEVARRLGAKRAVPLAVSAPFHSSLMAPAAAQLRQRLRDEPIAAPRIPVINNIDVAIESEPDRIRDALARQAAGPVRWAEIVRRMAREGVTHVVECGPGRVLAGLTKRIEPAPESLALTDPASIAEALSRLKEGA
jgi:[acyl-carrier-protein] S-malonyltransferase